ncbi:MAG: multidrug transporter AcrB [Ignavibacteriaceae bacterium]|nr:MAG: multidrug transporter AcrB [Ignavibacteriaceae bacterium]
MKIIEFAVKNFQFTLIIFLMVIAIGVNTILEMPRSEDPEMAVPEYWIVVVFPGTSPKDMEEMVVDPLEAKLTSLENIKKVSTDIKNGISLTWIQYNYGVDVESKYQEVIREVNNLRNTLPKEIYAIEVRKYLASNVNVLQTALISENASWDNMRKQARILKEELEQIPELKNVEIHGLPKKQVRIELSTDKMAQMNIPLEEVLGIVESEAVNIPGGSINAGARTYNIQTSGNYKSVEDIKNTVIHSYDGKNIFLKDIADVYFDFEKENYLTRLNGHRCVLVVAAQKPGENISVTQGKYLPVLEKFRSKLPPNMQLVQNFDQADNVNRRLGGLAEDFLIAILLVAITLLPLGGRASVIVMISIPLSLSIGIIMMNALGYTLNQLSIVGFVVALGLLVDDSIVVVENIERWIREGYSRYDATILGTKQIALAVIGCTATLIVAFLPLTLLPGSTGDFIRSQPMAVIVTVFASMLVALTVIPFLASRILSAHSGPTEGNIFLRGLKKAIHHSYAPLLDRALNHPVVTAVVALILFGGSLLMIPVIGFSLFPASEKPQFLVDVITPLQSNLDKTAEVAKEIEGELLKLPEVEFVTTNIGKGNPTVYYNILQEDERPDFAQLFVQLDEDTDTDKKTTIIDKLRKKWASYPGAKVEVKDFEQGPGVLAPVEIRLFGKNLDTLRTIAGQVEGLIKATDGTIYVNNPVKNMKSDIRVAINKEKAASLGIPSAYIDRTVRLAVAGIEAGSFNDDEGNSHPILVTREKEQLNTLGALENLYINNIEGRAIPLSQVASLQFVATPLSINHENKIRTVSVFSQIRKGYLADNVTRDVVKKLEDLKLPAGYSYSIGGEQEAREESFAGLTTILLVTVFLFIAILILEFKTFRSILIVLSVVPLGIVGAVLALWITGNSLSFVAVVGLIALAGIEVKNTILLVDFTNQLREQGKSVDDAIREAGEVRFLPIILTSMTAIGGLMPIALSVNPLISPLAVVLIGGLISSTLLSRVVTPVVYKLIPPKVEAV